MVAQPLPIEDCIVLRIRYTMSGPGIAFPQHHSGSASLNDGLEHGKLWTLQNLCGSVFAKLEITITSK